MVCHCSVKKYVQPLSITGKDVGPDVGISKFVTDTDKNEFEYPNNIDNILKKIRSQQRELSRKKKGSNAYKIAKHNVNRDYNASQNVLFDAYSLIGSRGKGLSPSSVEKNPLLNTISYKEIVEGKILC